MFINMKDLQNNMLKVTCLQYKCYKSRIPSQPNIDWRIKRKNAKMKT